MSTIDQEEILRNVRKLAGAAEAFNSKSQSSTSEIKDKIENETEIISNLIQTIYKTLSESISDKFSDLEKASNTQLAETKESIAQIKTRILILQDTLKEANENSIGLKVRLDEFKAQVDFLEKNTGSLATNQYVDNCISRNISEQTLVLKEQLASQKQLDKLTTGDEVKLLLSEAIDKVKEDLEMKIGGINDKGQLTGLYNQIDTIKNDLESRIGTVNQQGEKTGLFKKIDSLVTNKGFVFGILLTIGGSILGSYASSSWSINNALSPYQNLEEKVNSLEGKIEANHSTILQKLQEIEQ